LKTVMLSQIIVAYPEDMLEEEALQYAQSEVNEWAKQGMYEVHKSYRHYDGDFCFGGGWFIVVAVLPGGQISNHYQIADWDLFDIPEKETALYPFDGHTAEDVIKRLATLPKRRLMNFGEAIAKANNGEKIARVGWNAGGMFLYIVPAAAYPAMTATAKEYFKDNLVPYRAYWALKTAVGDIATWAPSCSDSLADDWIVVN